MKKIITITIIIIIIISIFFIKINYKFLKTGNNMSNKSAEEIEKYILDISSYTAKMEVTINSNKSTNKYILEEEYIKDNNVFKRKIIEPEYLNGVSIIYDGTNLKLENSIINVSKMYENYPYIGEDTISLFSFIEDYKNSDETNISSDEANIILKTKVKNGNKYINQKKLFIDKKTGRPIKLEIEDITQKTVIYILYNEIKINNLQKEDILAFKLKEISNNI